MSRHLKKYIIQKTGLYGTKHMEIWFISHLQCVHGCVVSSEVQNQMSDILHKPEHFIFQAHDVNLAISPYLLELLNCVH